MHDAQSSNRKCWWQPLGTRPWVVVLMRIIGGGVFIFAGFSKLALPHAEVVALTQQYTVIPQVFAPLIAMVLPWVEVLSGTALLIGFYTTPAAVVIAVQLLSFCLLMLVILTAGVNIEDCGCFGNLGWRETPLQVLVRDVVMLAMLWPVVTRQRDVWALDVWSHAATPPSVT